MKRGCISSTLPPCLFHPLYATNGKAGQGAARICGAAPLATRGVLASPGGCTRNASSASVGLLDPSDRLSATGARCFGRRQPRGSRTTSAAAPARPATAPEALASRMEEPPVRAARVWPNPPTGRAAQTLLRPGCLQLRRGSSRGAAEGLPLHARAVALVPPSLFHLPFTGPSAARLALRTWLTDRPPSHFSAGPSCARTGAQLWWVARVVCGEGKTVGAAARVGHGPYLRPCAARGPTGGSPSLPHARRLARHLHALPRLSGGLARHRVCLHRGVRALRVRPAAQGRRH